MARNKSDFLGLNGFVWFQGLVEDRADPLQIGRVRVRCFGWHTMDRSLIPTAELPWAHPIAPIGPNATITPPKEGDWVFGFFRDGEFAQQPVYMGIIPGIATGQSGIEVLIGDVDDRTLTFITADSAADGNNTHTSGGSGNSSNVTSGRTGSHNGGTVAPAAGVLFTFDGSQSRMCSDDAEENMKKTLEMHKQLESSLGMGIRINDALAKSGTSREGSTPGSQHFFGKALDLSTRGMSDDQKLQLVRDAKAVGFTSFGFGNTILHVDWRNYRTYWDYTNARFGGVLCDKLGTWVVSGGEFPTA